MSTQYPPCANCEDGTPGRHLIGVHDPCSDCAAEGRTCRSYSTTKTEGRRPYAERRPAKRRTAKRR